MIGSAIGIGALSVDDATGIGAGDDFAIPAILTWMAY